MFYEGIVYVYIRPLKGVFGSRILLIKEDRGRRSTGITTTPGSKKTERNGYRKSGAQRSG